MKFYRVRLARKALTDLELLYDYIADQLQSPEAAMRLYDKITEGIRSLKLFPERCTLLPEIRGCPVTMRHLLIEKYAIVYTVTENTVLVLRIIYGASDFIQKLQEEEL